jgi:hypothetical protein
LRITGSAMVSQQNDPNAVVSYHMGSVREAKEALVFHEKHWPKDAAAAGRAQYARRRS